MRSTSSISDQWIRRWSLVVYGSASDTALVLSAGNDAPDAEQLRMRFKIHMNGLPAPNRAVVRIYNPAPDTVNRVVREFKRVTLAAGYRTGRFSTIFDGWITQYRFGGETPVDKFLELYAMDADIGLNQVTVSKTHQVGANDAVTQWKTLYKAMPGVQNSPQLGQVTPVPNSRPVVTLGAARDEASVLARSSMITAGGKQHQGVTWSVQNGVLTLVPSVGGPVGGETAVINAGTGLIGFPTATNDGIELRTLLNPSLHVWQLLQINNKLINQVAPGLGGGTSGGYGWLLGDDLNVRFFAPTSEDGIYVAGAIDHEGDTRGEEWYTDIVAVTVDRVSQAFQTSDEVLPSDTEVERQASISFPGT